MVQADRVDVSQQSAQAGDAPAVTGTTKVGPVINRVAPELTPGGEVVRRHTGDKPRPVVRVQQEQLRVGPHVARIRGNEKWQVGHLGPAPGPGVVPWGLPRNK